MIRTRGRLSWRDERVVREEGSSACTFKRSLCALLAGHYDESSAFVVDDYPYGFRLRTQIRYWLERVPKKGVRFVSQTMDPKTSRWNKPKKSMFSRFAEAMYLDEIGHVQTRALNEYSSAGDVADYLRTFGMEGTMPELRDFVVVDEPTEEARARRATGA